MLTQDPDFPGSGSQLGSLLWEMGVIITLWDLGADSVSYDKVFGRHVLAPGGSFCSR